jgi:hypothetical protein
MHDELTDPHESDCAVCYADHDEEIHEATLSIHKWFRHQVTHEFGDDEIYLAEAV